MSEIVAVMRYFPGDAPVPFNEKDLRELGLRHGVKVSMEEVQGEGNTDRNGIHREETMNSAVEEVTQTMVTLSSEDEEGFRSCVVEMIKTYRAPRTIFALLGSNERGEQIVKETAEEHDGWM